MRIFKTKPSKAVLYLLVFYTIGVLSFVSCNKGSDNAANAEDTKPKAFNKDDYSEYFVCKVQGESMNKVIPNDSWCLFIYHDG